MKLHVNVRVPMGCPAPDCDGEDFYILMSHPFGERSKGMWVECNRCKHRFYTDQCDTFALTVRKKAQALMEVIKRST